MTQTLIIHVIRTNKIPFIQSQASRALTFTTLSIMAFGIWLPYSPLASSLGFTHLPTLYWPILVRDYACLRGADARHQSLAATQEMDLGLKSLRENFQTAQTKTIKVPLGTTESSPGRSPGVGFAKATSPQGRLNTTQEASLEFRQSPANPRTTSWTELQPSLRD